MLVFNKYFYKKKKSKLYFGDRVTVLNDFIYQTGGSTSWQHTCRHPPRKATHTQKQCNNSSTLVACKARTTDPLPWPPYLTPATARPHDTTCATTTWLCTTAQCHAVLLLHLQTHTPSSPPQADATAHCLQYLAVPPLAACLHALHCYPAPRTSPCLAGLPTRTTRRRSQRCRRLSTAAAAALPPGTSSCHLTPPAARMGP
jgi:hypothetical protein